MHDSMRIIKMKKMYNSMRIVKIPVVSVNAERKKKSYQLVVAFSLLAMILGECVTFHCQPVLFFLFKVLISLCTLIPLFRSRSVCSGLVS